MDVISEIRQFEQHPERAKFSALQINDFYKTLSGRTFKFEAIISAIKKVDDADYELHADTYRYTVLHNPVAERDYINWAPEMAFVCQAPKDLFPFNPLTDLIKGDRFHGSATFVEKKDKEMLVKLTEFNKVPFLEVEKEKELLEKRFNSAYEERTIYAPQRQFKKRAANKAFVYSVIGGLTGLLIGLFLGCLEAIFNNEDAIFTLGIEGALIGGLILGCLGFALGLLGRR